ncbi:hypothetical protein DPEC_G00165510, partial [Dallia pectoralis]
VVFCVVAYLSSVVVFKSSNIKERRSGKALRLCPPPSSTPSSSYVHISLLSNGFWCYSPQPSWSVLSLSTWMNS